jgi:hypothetical protein
MRGENMKSLLKITLAGLFVTTLVFAKSEQPPGEPPFGLAVQGDAKGTKLTGALFAEFYNCDGGTGLCAARIILRLRRSNATEFDIFFAQASGLDPANPGATQQDIIELMGPQVIDRFFGNNDGNVTNDPTNLAIKLKNVTEFGELGVATLLTPTGSQFVLTDLVIAVN